METVVAFNTEVNNIQVFPCNRCHRNSFKFINQQSKDGPELLSFVKAAV